MLLRQRQERSYEALAVTAGGVEAEEYGDGLPGLPCWQVVVAAAVGLVVGTEAPLCAARGSPPRSDVESSSLAGGVQAAVVRMQPITRD